MTVFRLGDSLIFPPPHLADADGLLAVGGDLSPQRLLLAYQSGIFPWYSRQTPILWWSLDPRLVLFPSELKVPKSLDRVMKKGLLRVTTDNAFGRVIQECAAVRRERGEGTWILPEMVDAYCRLHELGYAHSLEAWREGKLAGGLYGVSIGCVFFGESMFTRVTDASKAALIHLIRSLDQWGYELVDCQMTTSHLQRFGARELPRSRFLALLQKAVKKKPSSSSWR